LENWLEAIICDRFLLQNWLEEIFDIVSGVIIEKLDRGFILNCHRSFLFFFLNWGGTILEIGPGDFMTKHGRAYILNCDRNFFLQIWEVQIF